MCTPLFGYTPRFLCGTVSASTSENVKKKQKYSFSENWQQNP
jgi:hypothetical protein